MDRYKLGVPQEARAGIRPARYKEGLPAVIETIADSDSLWSLLIGRHWCHWLDGPERRIGVWLMDRLLPVGVYEALLIRIGLFGLIKRRAVLIV